MAAVFFFFIEKKDGGLRPFMNYRGLNTITVRYTYPLPLVSPALENLREAKIFIKLDLWNAYNLLQIQNENRIPHFPQPFRTSVIWAD